jgi:hypothetical protein
MLTEFAVLDHLLFLESHWAETPTTRIGVPLHDTPLDFGDDTMIARCKFNCRHLRNGERNGFACEIKRTL